ncbi:hypothetical protein CsSME_00044399 [Camellia sinensis var. sinensis]
MKMILIQICCGEQQLEMVAFGFIHLSASVLFVVILGCILYQCSFVGPPESIFDWTTELDSDLSNQNANNQAFSRKQWRLLQCQNGLRIFEEPLEVDFLPKSCSRAMKAVGVVEATCEEVFELVMSMNATRFEWDCSFQDGRLVEEVDGHTAILYQKLQLDWFPM